MAALRLSGRSTACGGLPERPRLGLRRDLRLRRRADFARVYDRGRILNDALLVLRVLPNELPHNRYGFVVSGKVGGAVVRNRVRRRLQEIVRLMPGDRGQGTGDRTPHHDLVLSCKAASAEASYQELEASVRKLFAKAGLLSGPDGHEASS